MNICELKNSAGWISEPRFWGAARQYQAILRCSTSISSDFAESPQNQPKKLDLAERIRMHRSRASGASNLPRYDLFCAVAKFIIAKFRVPQGRIQKKCHSEI